jgi:hypothetical protein
MIPRIYSLHTGDPHCCSHSLLSPKQKCVTEETSSSRATQILVFNSSFISEQVLGLIKKCAQELDTTQIKFMANDMVTSKKLAVM